MEHSQTPSKADATTLQVRIAGWHLACGIAHWLDGHGYHFTETPCTNLRPGQYTGRPFLAAPDVRPRPWLVAWHPYPDPEPTKAKPTPEVVSRFLAALEHTSQAAQGLGLALAGTCLAATAFRLAKAVSAQGTPITDFDQFLILASLAAANALLFAAAARIVPVLGRAWRWAQGRLGSWLLARSLAGRA